ncbi:hypothetical protein AVEN_213373-1 [Araneus ventricosus]|uniref:Uncharacterized protein n=1 Tax=Araneus ventricosus TaxID=182803 RepID=A0A4Y2N856_ARAVE|nr:hypothetical protein AVEN_213373-1 [Araneus ventricosus]
MDTVLYQQDSDAAHFFIPFCDYLKGNFPRKSLYGAPPRLWASHLPRLTPLDIFVKSNVYSVNMYRIGQLKSTAEMFAITPNELESTFPFKGVAFENMPRYAG